ncbi:MAG: HAD-IA family hydrolase [Cyanobacteria bacterium]|nr:HAD-IA family hydrolase [Cyanobacteria bacterium CG_2015-16_32_12]NCO78173.1 HAD-IA family hydrolase [Cyanobacteria bacterium CG_2015-22_32_23]NCQ04606.1 HAD-IA family hydrolase [Cyanobacteria bacterium CG_2015-09_32_10]NCQ43143.1 HAD-IA family hydrolase [Cyanobacteria bacterium CG_2015-04_32_10]NCS84164.1 HAD-IA family hydrolase [Cyanobacteria bacterium CG_2015-02_32_10]
MSINYQPKVIFLDAVGTIFGVKNSVGDIYTKLAKKYGVNREAEIINHYFYQAFKNSSPLAFEEENEEKIKDLEFQWWQNVTYKTFHQNETINDFTDFNTFFIELYNYFKTSQPWVIYDDVIPSLNQWQKQGIELGIISNFDTRIYDVLDNLNLRQYFQTITISSLTGVAKPEDKIFLTALAKHNCQPENAWYIGDSVKEDYWGGKSVGMQCFWLNRKKVTS